MRKILTLILSLTLILGSISTPTIAYSETVTTLPYEDVLNKVSDSIVIIGGHIKINNDALNQLTNSELALIPEIENDLKFMYYAGNVYINNQNEFKFRTTSELITYRDNLISKNDFKLCDSEENEVGLRSLPDQPAYFSLQSLARSHVTYLDNYFNDLWNLMIKYPGLGIMPQLETEIEFASNVAEGQPWDYKRQIGWNVFRTVKIDGTDYYLTGEDIGNIHYAYVGRSIGFSTTTLKQAGGVVQVLTSGGAAFFTYSLDSYYDDPNDQAAIVRGANWYDFGMFR